MCLVHVHVLENVRTQCLTLVMRGSRNFSLGGGRGGVKAGWPKHSLDQLILQFTEGVQWVYNRENYTFDGSRGGPTFSKGGGGWSTFFHGRGVQMLFL